MLALGPTQLPLQWIAGTLSPMANRPRHTSPSAKFTNAWSSTSTYPYSFVAGTIHLVTGQKAKRDPGPFLNFVVKITNACTRLDVYAVIMLRRLSSWKPSYSLMSPNTRISKRPCWKSTPAPKVKTSNFTEMLLLLLSSSSSSVCCHIRFSVPSITGSSQLARLHVHMTNRSVVAE